jgi:NADPH:quinone reductase-like Zn-dependent oxidoreductase
MMRCALSGLQVVGRVTEVRVQGDRSLIGKKVVALLPAGGGYAQFATAPASMTIVLPDSAAGQVLP